MEVTDLGVDMSAAAFHGNHSFLEEVLGPDTVNLRDRHGDTPLHRAALSGQVECVYLLLEGGADPDARGEDGGTPLHRVAAAVDCIQPETSKGLTSSKIQDSIVEITNLLVARGGQLGLQDSQGKAPADIARDKNFTDLADLMEKLKVDQEEHQKSMEKMKLQQELHLNCLSGSIERVSEIIDKMPSLLMDQLYHEDPPLLAAVQSGSRDLVRYLVRRENCSLLNPFSEKSALHIAVERRDKEMVICLLDCLPRVLRVDQADKRSSLHIAAELGHVELVEIFLGLVEQFHESQKLAQFRVVNMDEVEADDLELLSGGLNPFFQVKKTQSTPLHLAVERGHVGVVKTYCHFLKRRLEKHQDDHEILKGLELLNKTGYSVFHIACKKSNFEIMEQLLCAGVDVNALALPGLDRMTNPNLTALSMAGSMGNTEVVRFLLRHGAKDTQNKALHRSLKRDNNSKTVGLQLSYNEYANVLPAAKNHQVPHLEGKQPDWAIHLGWQARELKVIDAKWFSLVLEERVQAPSMGVITRVELSSNQLSELPMELFQLPCLTYLDVSKNNLEFLPTQGNLGWKCPNLITLKARNNMLKALPSELFALPYLETVDVSSNLLESLPQTIWLAPKLKVLKANNNKLVRMPFPSPKQSTDSLGDDYLSITMSSSDSADNKNVSYNQSLIIDDVFSLPLLEVKRLSKLCFTEPGASASIREIKRSSRKKIDMHSQREGFSRYFNKFGQAYGIDTQELAAGPVQGVEDNPSCLETLELSGNQLTSIPIGLSCLAPKLMRLILTNNQIQDLGYLSDYPTQLNTLDVQNNCVVAAIRPSLGASEKGYRNSEALPISFCPYHFMLKGEFQSIASSVPCSHRLHKTLHKFSTYKLNNNKIKQLMLFVKADLQRIGSEPERGDRESFIDTGIGAGSGFSPQKNSEEKENKKSLHSSSSGHSSGNDEESQPQSAEAPKDVQIPLFPELGSLEVANNLLTKIPSCIHLCSRLGYLNISHNNITMLPLEMGHLGNLYGFEYEGVPLRYPSVADLNKFTSVGDKMYFMKTLLQDAKPNDSMKLMLVGLQKRGKTTLLRHLMEINELDVLISIFNMRVAGEDPKKPQKGGAPPLSTVGVDLSVWKYTTDKDPAHRPQKGSKKNPSVTFYTWDFGGQEEYYATHQAFLSRRSLYLLIWDVRDGEKGIDDLAPWLHNIEARAPQSPVIVIGTHIDQLESANRQRELHEFKELIETRYQERYTAGQYLKVDPGLPVIKAILFVALPDPKRGKVEGVSELRKHIYNTAWKLKATSGVSNKVQSNQLMLQERVPASFLKLQEKVGQLASQIRKSHRTPVLTEKVFREEVMDVIDDKRELDQAVTFLHENGMLLHYDTPSLNHLYFIDPQWLCDMMAHVITVPAVNSWISEESGLNSGILRKSCLQHVFNGKVFPIEFQNEYVEFLNKFEVAIQIDKNSLLVPSCLSCEPRFTVHKKYNVFPRPSLSEIAKNIPEMFSNQSDNAESLSNEDGLMYPHFTGLFLRRFYFMPHVPSGFWPRIISRLLSDTSFHSIILRGLGCDTLQVEEMVKARSSKSSVLSWTYWRTGIELWYQTTSILRVSEITHSEAFKGCTPSPSPFLGSTAKPMNAACDAQDLIFDLHGQWTPVDPDNSPHGIEVVISDVVSRKVVENSITVPEENMADLNESMARPLDQSSSEQVPPPHSKPRTREPYWIAAHLLANTVEVLDLLLEDWYPGIGLRNAAKKFEIPFVNRIVPCPFCTTDATAQTVNELSVSSSTKESSLGGSSKLQNKSLELPTADQPLDHKEKRTFPFLRKQDSIQKRTSKKQNTVENSFLQVNKFGFMVDTLVCASRKSDSATCQLHGNLLIQDLAPDLVFADFHTQFLLDNSRLLRGAFIGGGSFGDIYRGQLLPYPGASDLQGVDVAIKVATDESPRKAKVNSEGNEAYLKEAQEEVILKTYLEMRYEGALLRQLVHDNLIRFQGISTKPMSLVLEWAPKGSLKKVLSDFDKAHMKLSPHTLQETTKQIASGLAYLHQHGIVHFDMKADNVLVFKFPSIQHCLEKTMPASQTSRQVSTPFQSPQKRLAEDPMTVLMKITDFGISRRSSLTHFKGHRGTPGFFAPEILKYSGKEAVQSKVDIYSYSMVMYELLTFLRPFEKENFHIQQIDKLTIEGKRPVLGSMELNSPVMYLDLMQWCWMGDYNKRPTARQLTEMLSNPTIPHLMDVINLGKMETVTCVCTSPLLIQRQNLANLSDLSVSQTHDDKDYEQYIAAHGGLKSNVLNMKHSLVTHGDMFQELWIASFDANKYPSTELHIVTFQGRAKHFVQSLCLQDSPVTAMCPVSGEVDVESNIPLDLLWVGTDKGELYIFHAWTRTPILDRYLALRADTGGIVAILKMPSYDSHAVVVIRKDGCLLLFNDFILANKAADHSEFDNSRMETELPVRAVCHTRNELPVHCALVLSKASSSQSHIFCGCSNGVVQCFVHNYGRLEYQTNLKYGNFLNPVHLQRFADLHVSQLCESRTHDRPSIWALIQPDGILMNWDATSGQPLQQLMCMNFTSYKVNAIAVVESKLYLSTSAGRLTVIDSPGPGLPPTSKDLHGHQGEIWKTVSLGARILPQQWLPCLIGRINVIDLYSDDMEENELSQIQNSIIGRQTNIGVSIGRGYQGFGKMNPLSDAKDNSDTFVLLWM